MTQKNQVANVMLWGKQVGIVDDSYGLQFQYSKEWLESGVEVSPIRMKLSSEIYEFKGLENSSTFQGLPGLLADALPDQFGSKLAESYFAKQGRTIASISPVEKLLYMGKRAMGALEFEPVLRKGMRHDASEIIEVRTLVEQSRRLIQGQPKGAIRETLAELMSVGGSAGGARPKAVVLWNREKNEMKSGFAAAKSGDESWLIKFDGTGTIEHPSADPKPYNRIEYVYSLLAAEAGIKMSETAIFEDGDLAHFMTKRFDRLGEKKHHVHSLCGMLHSDFNVPQTLDYIDVLDLCQKLKMNSKDVEQMFKRMAFNVIGVNQDDHTKNFAFIRKQNEDWALAPAYDLSYVKGLGWTKQHQLRVGGMTDSSQFSNQLMVSIGQQFGLSNAQEILEEVGAAFEKWSALALDNGVPKNYIEAIASEHRLNLTKKPNRTKRKA
jgi:serine/threonine-protein kinase HipA